jgi:hypothetical protein
MGIVHIGCKYKGYKGCLGFAISGKKLHGGEKKIIFESVCVTVCVSVCLSVCQPVCVGDWLGRKYTSVLAVYAETQIYYYNKFLFVHLLYYVV